jgi:hypothetical protein
MMAELIPTFVERQLGSLAGGHHRVRMSLAHGSLTRRQSCNPVADDAGAEGDDRRHGSVKTEENLKVDDDVRHSQMRLLPTPPM